MAKQKIANDDTPQNEVTQTTVEPTEVLVEIQQNADVEQEQITADVPTSEPTPQKAKVTEKPTKATTVEAVEPDEVVRNTLKMYSQYPTLFVDRLGGVFTPDTPTKIRGTATLYKNPFYKS